MHKIHGSTVRFVVQSPLVIVYLVIVEYLEIVEKTPATVFLFLVSLLSRNSGLFVKVDSFRATNKSTITRGDSIYPKSPTDLYLFIVQLARTC